MALLTQIKDNGLEAKSIQSKKNKALEHAAKVLAESTLASRCPNLAKDLEAGSKDAKYKAATMIQLLENTASYFKSEHGRDILKEDATSAVSLLNPGVASLTPKVVDIVNVFYPNMVAHHFCDIQALDRQSGQIFIIKTVYSDEAATVKKGDIVFEDATDGTYASEVLTYEGKEAAEDITVDAPTDLPAGDECTVKVRAGSFIVRIGGKEIARDYGNGASDTDGKNTGDYIVIGRGVSGSINAQTGAGTIKLDPVIYAEEIAATATVTFEASVDTETDDKLIRKIQFEIPNQPIMAKEHPLMSSYSVAAGLVMNAHLAIDTDELISNQLAGTIRWERDLAAVKAVSNAATLDSTLGFDCSANGANLTLAQRYSSYKTVVSSARGLIQEKAGRGTVEFMIVSAKQGLPVVENIESFKAAPESKKPIGPYLAGTLNEGTIAVIAVPYSKTLPEDQVIFGFKGFQLGDSAIVLAEWIPLYFTPTYQAPNLKNHKGCLSFYDLFVNKANYLVKGTISNFNVA
jgi:hypothetical protein